MSVRGKSLRGSLVLTLGEGVIYGSSFVRNMILARMLTKADFGIAAAFSMIITLLEFSAKLGISRFVIRDKEGDDPEFLATAHMVQGLAAVLSSLLMAAAAWPMALLFGIGDHVGALLVLAAIPLLLGVTHLDVKRFERELRFGPSTWAEVIPQLTITLAAWPVAAWFGDYRAVVALLIVKALLTLIASHWWAEQPYRWRLHPEYATRMLRFGWPLLVSGLLMFGVLHGDQFIVASFYTMSDLGPYAAAASLTMAPSFFFGRVFSSVMLPVMAKAQDDAGTFERRYRLVIGVIAAFSVVYSVVAIVAAEVLMQLVFGRKYEGAGILLGWLSAGNAFRNIRIAPTIAAMAKGDSVNQMVSNLWRVTALIPAAAVAVAGQSAWMIAATGLFGEALACWASFARLTRRDNVPLVRSLVPTALVLVAVTLAGFAAWRLGAHQAHPFLALSAAIVAACLGGAIVIFVLADTRQEAGRLWHHARAAGWRGLLPPGMRMGMARKPVAP